MKQRTRYRIALGLLLILMLGLLSILGAREKIRTDVFSLLEDAYDGNDAAIIQGIIDAQSRVIAIRIDSPQAADKAESALATLEHSPGISRACVMDMYAFAQVGTVLKNERMSLLFPRFLSNARAEWERGGKAEDFEQWLAKRSVQSLDEFLASPESLAMSDLLPQDPLLLLPGALKAGDIAKNARGADSAVILAEASGPATDSDTQKAVIAAVDTLKAQLAAQGCELHASGAVFFAQRSERLIRADVLRLNLLMVVLLLVLSLTLLRSVLSIAALALPVLMAALGAVCVLLGFFPSIYALSLGIGGILGGIALDYPVHIMLHRRRDEPGFVPAFRRVARPLILGCLSTVLVFMFLLFSDLPLIRQIGLLVGAGLLICCMLTLPALEAFPPTADPERTAERICALKFPTSRRALIGVSLILALCSIGAFRLCWGDAIDALQIPMPDLMEEDVTVRKAARGIEAGNYFAASGESLGAAISKAGEHAEGLAAVLSTPEMIGSAANWQQEHGAQFQADFSAELEARGFDSSMFEPLFSQPLAPDLAQAQLEGALDNLRQALPAGLGWMMGKSEAGAWIVSAIPAEFRGTDELPRGLHVLDTRAQLRRAFSLYRADTARLAAIGFAVSAMLILLVNGLRRGTRTLLIPLLSTGATLGLLGAFGMPVNLFHVVGLLLGFGLTLDYALFTIEGGSGKASVRFSALSTLCAFAALTTSAIPAVRGLGLSVLLMIVFTMLQCELHKNDEPAR
ncbi:MAG: MMPL family transporter [Opitutales bacterium]|jgi:predicted exporter